MAVYGYTRSATPDPDQLAKQRDRIGAFFIEGQGPVAEFFEDYATGFNPPDEREGYARMCSQLKPGDIVLVAELDRISRSARVLGEAIDALRDQGVTLLIAFPDEG